jgi:hypothetical protein
VDAKKVMRMGKCAHGNFAPDEVIETWPECQAGEGRHKCAVCAYALGLAATAGNHFDGPVEHCDQGHDLAPKSMLKGLPNSQAGLQRHKCAYRAFQDGRRAGADAATAANQEIESSAESAIKTSEISETEKADLLLARRGQGVFRQRTLGLNPICRLTGVSSPEFLRAGHIKPWRSCNNDERLDGLNGIPLSPHADHLFDRGWISFKMDGTLLISPSLSQSIVDAWKITDNLLVIPFPDNSAKYIDFHHNNIYRS